jgi:hypothetical protein
VENENNMLSNRYLINNPPFPPDPGGPLITDPLKLYG